MSGKIKEASLYFHIPFCSKKCSYCHFYVLPERDADKTLLMQGFKAEWLKALPLLTPYKIVSIYFGGGTPSLLGAHYIEEILTRIQPEVETEITLEANPENCSETIIRDYKEAGINRLSIGAQAFDDPMLISLGRTHNKNRIESAVLEAFKVGIKNISIDLMYDLPQQTLEQWRHTLKKATSLPISHLSLYNLTVEPHTAFYKKRKSLIFPDPKTSLAMYLTATEELEKNGLKQYEISAFAKEGKQSRHNLGYWTARPFLGFGPSAFSYWEGKRFRNIAHLRKYHQLLEADQSPVDFEERLDYHAAQRELLAVRIRLLEGVNLEKFEKQHGKLEKEILNTLHDLVNKGWLAFDGSTIKLTAQGILFYDSLASEII
ncbi:Oxygen-independent coproporphyrinogen-III oxidase-like protein YqeR [Chlamydiales bacterium STE3]|nr:Oxygen-independent coproporphyrinogen-III oxidase-like protein YqeR [Chlamydiales bacterium STE3]